MASKGLERLKRLRNRFARLRHPKHFRMAQVAIKTDCGAAMCFIGHTLVAEGYKMRLRKQWQAFRGCDAARSDYDFISPAGRRSREPYRAAQRLLGLSWREAEDLFQDFRVKTIPQAIKKLDALIAAKEQR